MDRRYYNYLCIAAKFSAFGQILLDFKKYPIFIEIVWQFWPDYCSGSCGKICSVCALDPPMADSPCHNMHNQKSQGLYRGQAAAARDITPKATYAWFFRGWRNIVFFLPRVFFHLLRIAPRAKKCSGQKILVLATR
jgi:hypothetical protein